MVWEQGLELVRELLHGKNYFLNGSKKNVIKIILTMCKSFCNVRRRGGGRGTHPQKGENMTQRTEEDGL